RSVRLGVGDETMSTVAIDHKARVGEPNWARTNLHTRRDTVENVFDGCAEPMRFRNTPENDFWVPGVQEAAIDDRPHHHYRCRQTDRRCENGGWRPRNGDEHRLDPGYRLSRHVHASGLRPG